MNSNPLFLISVTAFRFWILILCSGSRNVPSISQAINLISLNLFNIVYTSIFFGGVWDYSMWFECETFIICVWEGKIAAAPVAAVLCGKRVFHLLCAWVISNQFDISLLRILFIIINDHFSLTIFLVVGGVRKVCDWRLEFLKLEDCIANCIVCCVRERERE